MKCICGRPTKVKKNGKMGKTCGRKGCAGLSAKAHMEEVLKTKQIQMTCWNKPRTIGMIK